MSDIAIRVDNLGKRYRLGQMEPYKTLRESLVNAGKKLFHRVTRPSAQRDSPQDLWALKDVSFEVKQGEVVGIIGRNGAGKSTLLKILSRITEPTTGYAELNGRVGSLLEVGTGFHPELTGRENIFLNGAILGMTRAEIKSKFDEIVAFAEIEKFLDTPVKRYSSGMYVRLAFAVAAHLDPEILIVDEVLAVGDAEFQRKCLGKMKDVATGGRTVLFVSHNMAAVEALCGIALLLAQGVIVGFGSTRDILDRYLTATRQFIDSTCIGAHRKGTGEMKITRFALLGMEDQPVSAISMGAGVRFELAIVSQTTSAVEFSVGLYNSLGQRVTTLNSAVMSNGACVLQKNRAYRVLANLPCLNLMPGHYHANVAVQRSAGKEPYDYIENALFFEVLPADVYGTGRLPAPDSCVYFAGSWSVQPSECAVVEAH